MARHGAWVFQPTDEVKRVGAENAAFYVGWYTLDGRRRKESCGPGGRGKKRAEARARQIENQLMAGTDGIDDRVTWAEFRARYEAQMGGKAPTTRREVKAALDHFERILDLGKVYVINTGHIDDFIARRRKEPGQKRGSTVSPATVNKDLRHIKAALTKAKKWNCLRQVPDFEWEREPQKIPRYVTGEHFGLLYAGCGHARKPADLPGIDPADWWRALLVFLSMTGWRISEALALRRDDLDTDAGSAITRAEDNKGRRDELVRLHPVVLEHLARIPTFDPCVFPWNHDMSTLNNEFAKLQEKAGINLPCRGDHQHTRHCHTYGFHDLRRAFATTNAAGMTGDALQKLMRHKSYDTTKRYINLAGQLDQAVAALHVPEALRPTGTARTTHP